jgi:hypothetical protein
MAGMTQTGDFFDLIEPFKQADITVSSVSGEDAFESNTWVETTPEVLRSMDEKLNEYLGRQVDRKSCALSVCIASLDWLTLQMYRELRDQTHFRVKAQLNRNQTIILMVIVASYKHFDLETFGLK